MNSTHTNLVNLVSLPKSLAATAFILCSLAVAGTFAQPVSWPVYGGEGARLRLDDGNGRGDGLTNSLPDFVGPVDGSAKLTIFTEGNHYPVLLPLVLDAFPRWCSGTEQCAISRSEILVVTLPPVMIVEGLERGGFRFGNAHLPVRLDGPVFPDIVMLGAGSMKHLEEKGMLMERPRIFAKHRGLGLLLRKDRAAGLRDLAEFATSDLRFVVATPNEAGARRQYIATLDKLLGAEQVANLFTREVEHFPGRLGIQHRDVPYALLNDLAGAGVIFGHLARFYAERWPGELVFIEVPAAAAFGKEITAARTARARNVGVLAEAFLEFLFLEAPDAYAAGGFAPVGAFGFGEVVPR